MIQMCGNYVPGTCPWGPKLQYMFKRPWTLTWDTTVIEHRMMNANEVLSFNLDNSIIGNKFGTTKSMMGYCKDLDPKYS